MTRESAAHFSEQIATGGALVVGRHLFDITNGWGGRHPMDVPWSSLTHTPAAGAGATTRSCSSPTASRRRSPGRASSRATRTSVVNGGQMASQALQAEPDRRGLGRPRPGPARRRHAVLRSARRPGRRSRARSRSSRATPSPTCATRARVQGTGRSAAAPGRARRRSPAARCRRSAAGRCRATVSTSQSTVIRADLRVVDRLAVARRARRDRPLLPQLGEARRWSRSRSAISARRRLVVRVAAGGARAGRRPASASIARDLLGVAHDARRLAGEVAAQTMLRSRAVAEQSPSSARQRRSSRRSPRPRRRP